MTADRDNSKSPTPRAPRQRFAIITFDPDRFSQLDWQAEGSTFAWIIRQALSGRDYPKERGIINITLLDRVSGEEPPAAALSPNRE